MLKVDEDFSDVGDLTSDTASDDDDSRVLNMKSLNFIKILTCVIKINNYNVICWQRKKSVEIHQVKNNS